MNWDSQLSSIISVADDSVAKMRERLTSPGKLLKGSETVEEKICDSDFKAPALPPRAPLLQRPPPSLSPGVQWADLAAVQSQLQIQNQVIESLTQRVRDMERERHSQHCRFEALQEEVHRLHEELREREKEKVDLWSEQSPGVERRMEQWRREVGRELGNLRGDLTRATSHGNLEESLSRRLHREEVDQLRRDVDQLKMQLRRKEEDMILLQTDARETRRRYDQNCKTLQELTDSSRAHSIDLARTASQYSNMQREVCQISATVSEMKAEVRSLVLRESQPAPLLSAHTSGASPLQGPRSHRSGVKAEEAEQDSDSDDFSPTPSLAEISSDDLSWLDDRDHALHQRPQVRLSVRSRRSEFASLGTDVEEEDDNEDDDEDGGDNLFDDDVNPDLGSGLTLDDL